MLQIVLRLFSDSEQEGARGWLLHTLSDLPAIMTEVCTFCPGDVSLLLLNATKSAHDHKPHICGVIDSHLCFVAEIQNDSTPCIDCRHPLFVYMIYGGLHST